jgi:uncharacterized protein (DUF1697 family)
MEYLALLRGINVGGKAVIKMTVLKKTAEECGFTQVRTYIQSGNVIFESDAKNADKLSAKLEEALKQKFGIDSPIIMKTRQQMEAILAEAPPEWKEGRDLKCYVAFVLKPVSVQEVLREVELKEGADFVKTGYGVLYFSTLLSGITRSGFSKLSGKKIYQALTIRNFNTVQKLFEMMVEVP